MGNHSSTLSSSVHNLSCWWDISSESCTTEVVTNAHMRIAPIQKKGARYRNENRQKLAETAEEAQN